jgi:hypothetical protein
MARKRVSNKKHGKSGAIAKRHHRVKKHAGPKASLELTNYLLESHPEFGK